jgi:SAM-dependent methyltransferase
MIGYDDIAGLYNLAVERDVGASAFAPAAARALLRFCAEHGLVARDSPVVDLGCGPGHLVALLAAAGFSVTGVDISENMLALAHANAQARGVEDRVTLTRADILEFVSVRPAALVTATFNVINHIPPEQLRSLFQNVVGSLQRAGTFIFDVNTENKLSAWNGTSFQELTGTFEGFNGASIIKRASYDSRARRACRELICFCERQDQSLYERRVSTTYSYAHGLLELSGLLTTAGFESVQFADTQLEALPAEQDPEALEVVYLVARKGVGR